MTQTPADHDFKIGPYRVIRHIAQGGMGAVYEVEDPARSGRYALKLAAQASKESSKFFEIHRVLSSAPHPGIVTSHAIGTTQDGRSFQLWTSSTDSRPSSRRPWVTWYSGANDRRRDSGHPPREVVAHLHAHGIIHRDIKSANVMVRTDQSACLIDFDSAILPESPPTLGHFVGTYSYAPPEQIRGEAVDGRADIYAMGVLLYRMLCGRRPFEAETTEALIDQQLYARPRLLELVPDSPSGSSHSS